ncbi:MAG: GTPase ObgE [Alphaproteobacteria bacterium]|jgi:GTP-binding protein|nr:GTPase ObgE [Alphaproteobacteria bacterium]
MRFIDSAKIYIKAGNGGKGCISFRREKFIEFGGPDGGDGGNGANVYFKAVGNLNTLIDFRYRQHFKAPNGRGGAGRNRYGEKGEDLIIEVPIGTVIMDEFKENIIVDMAEEGQIFKIAQAGIGGKGNAHFKSSTNRAPRMAQPGTEGEELWVWLELEILADIGLIGLPNAGKSTLISTITNAKSKAANYAFTTLKPSLGVLVYKEKQIVIADLPGLIEGASEGIGLGARFLSHVKRCKAFIHIIDVEKDVVESYNIIRKEIANYDKENNNSILEKPQIIVLNKIDLIDEDELHEKINELEQITKSPIITISALEKEGLKDLFYAIEDVFDDLKPKSDIAKPEWNPLNK